ncbi:hypothetical protein ACS6ZZ_03210 [Streptococcus suis]|nr:hypothetical protein [Streptococcus suis]
MMNVLILIFGILALFGSIIFAVLIVNNKYRFALGHDRELTQDLTSLKE